MNQYYELLNLVFTHQPCTKFHLEHLKNGIFKRQIDECIANNYICANGKNENGDDLYYITIKGKRIVDNPSDVL